MNSTPGSSRSSTSPTRPSVPAYALPLAQCLRGRDPVSTQAARLLPGTSGQTSPTDQLGPIVHAHLVALLRLERGARCGQTRYVHSVAVPNENLKRDWLQAVLQLLSDCRRFCSCQSTRLQHRSTEFNKSAATGSTPITWNQQNSTDFNKVRNLVRDQGVGGSNPLSPTNLSLALSVV